MKYRILRWLVAAGLLAAGVAAAGSPDQILQQLSLEEKIDLLGLHFREGIPSKEIRPISLADGPLGFNRNIGKKTPAYPATQLLAATFNPALAEEYADSLAADWLIGGADVFLAPGLNVQRVPVNGRNAEYYGEDPFLIASMVGPVIRTIQSHGLMAVAKHFIGNNQDYNRYRSSSMIEERPLQEIYFPGFKAAVQAGVGGLMAGHNRFNGMYCVESEYLGRVLRNDWNFDGLFISDWNGRHDAEKAFRAQLDVDAPMGRQVNAASIRPLIEAHPELEAHLNDKVRRILRARERFQVRRDDPLKNSSFDRKQSRKVALDIAREGIVLLKNENGVLPLSRSQTIALTGSLAAPFEYSPAGSACVLRPLPIEPLPDALQKKAATVLVSPHGFMDELCLQSQYAEPVQVELFDNENGVGDPLKTWTTDRIFIQSGADLPCEIVNPFGSEYMQSKIIADGKELQNFSLRFSTVIVPESSGDYFFATASAEGMWVTLDGKLILDGETMGYVKNHHTTLSLEGGRAYTLEVRHRRRMRAYEARFGYGIKETVLQRLTGASLAEQADVAIIAAGYGRDFEGEDTDRTFELPDFQSWFIQEVAARAGKTVVVAFAGGSFETASWLDQVDALLWVSYPGMSGAAAIADILFGDTCPSGKLPFTFDADFKDNPAYPYYVHQRHDMEYGEGIYVGYRGFDKNGIAPLFPFGHGLSYTSFEYSDMQVRLEDGGAIVTLNVKNTGPVAGRETVQLYVADPVCTVDRPSKELKGFASVDLNPGEARSVEIRLTKNAFQFFHPDKKMWMSEPGEFVLMAGSSAGDIRLRKAVFKQ